MPRPAAAPLCPRRAAAGLDAGYATAGIVQGLEERAILGVTGYNRPTQPKPGVMSKNDSVFERDQEGYRCPQGQLLAYAATDRSGYRHCHSDLAICRNSSPISPAAHSTCARTSASSMG